MWSFVALVILESATSSVPREIDLASDRSSINILAIVPFSHASGRVPAEIDRQLAPAVTWLRRHPDHLLYVEGHADPAGSSEASHALSLLRAELVRDQLIRAGVDPRQLIVAAYGDEDAAQRAVIVRGSDRAFTELLEAQREL